MQESTVSVAVVQSKPAKVIVFNNHLPLRTRATVHELWLRYDYLDFGGHYFEWCECAKEPGKYHCWLHCKSAYNNVVSTTMHLGLFGNYEELLPLIKHLDFETQGAIIEHLAKDYSDAPGEIVIPEC